MSFFFTSCSNLEKTEQETLREQNAKGEYIYRKENEKLYSFEEKPVIKKQESYPWQK